MTTKSRPPCEGVGRNDYEKSIESDDVVALHVRAWVEIFWVCGCKPGQGVALHVRAWVEISKVMDNKSRIGCRPPCEGVGRNDLRC